MSASPDGGHTAILQRQGEVRHGPACFRLELDGKSVAHRIFGEELRWSDDSCILAVQEWLASDYAEGPITRVTALTTAAARRAVVFSDACHGPRRAAAGAGGIGIPPAASG